MKRFNFWAMFTLLFVALVPLFTSCTEETVGDDSEEKEVSLAFNNSEISVSAEESAQQISYKLQNAGEGFKLEATTENDWITSIAVVDTANAVKFTVAANNTAEPREGKITLVYTCGTNMAEASLTVKQAVSEGVNSFFKLSIPETGSTWATIKIDVEDENMRYMISRIDAETMEGYLSDEVLIADEMRSYQEMAAYYGLPVETVLDLLALQGDKPTAEDGDIAFTQLDTETEYYAYCYGFDAEWNVVTPVAKVKFSTKAIGSENLSIEFENVENDGRSVSFDIVTSSFDTYTCVLFPKSLYDESIKDMDAFKEDLATGNYSIMGGPSRGNVIRGLSPLTDYVLVAMGRADDTPTSEIFTYEFTTKEVVESAAKFTFDYRYCDGVEFEDQYGMFGEDMSGYAVIYPKASVTEGVDYRYEFLNTSVQDVSDEEIINYLSSQGMGVESEGYIFAFPYDTELYVCGVGIDEDGNYGKLVREPLKITTDGCVTVNEFVDFIGVPETRSGSYVAPWLKSVKGVNKEVKPFAIGLQPKEGIQGSVKCFTLK